MTKKLKSTDLHQQSAGSLKVCSRLFKP